MKTCKGWWADGEALGVCTDCPIKKKCYDDWVESGGRMGGIFDKAMEGK